VTGFPEFPNTPYRGVRYHLSEFGSTNRHSNARELYNLRHSSLRVIVERAIGALKNQFRILENKPFHNYKTQVKLVLACAILHNWILGFGIDVVVPIEEGFTGSPPEEWPKILLPCLQLGIPSAMLCGKGGVHQGFDWHVICCCYQLLGAAMELMFVLR
jgi:hypothetical protein